MKSFYLLFCSIISATFIVVGQSNVTNLSDSNFPLRIVKINNDSVLHIVWWQNDNSYNVLNYELEKSVNNGPFIPIISARIDTLIDIMTLNQGSFSIFDKIFYSTESGTRGYFYNDIIGDVANIVSLTYRVKIITPAFEYYTLQKTQSFNGSLFIKQTGICIPSGQLPSGYCYGKSTDSELFYDGTKCCFLTNLPIYECVCTPTDPINCLNPNIDCGAQCECEYDPCCVHPCYAKGACTCNAQIETDPNADPIWEKCGDKVMGEYLYDVVRIEPVEIEAGILSGTLPLQCGQCVTLFASGINATVVWSTEETTNTITVCPLTTTTYTVTVVQEPEGNGIYCETTASITIPVYNSEPPVDIIGPQSICIGSSATLSAISGSSNYSYQWTTGETAQSIIVTSSATYTYFLTSTLPNGCFEIDEFTINVNSNPFSEPVCIKNEINNDCVNPAIYETNWEPTSADTYNWSAINGTVTSTSDNSAIVDWNIPPYSTGTLIISAFDNETQCSSLPCSLTVFPCCRIKGAVDLSDSKSSISGNQSNSTIVINGTFTVNTDVTFQNCKIWLGPNARITVNNGKSLTLHTSSTGPQTILGAGCGYMWDGILLNGAASQLFISSDNPNLPTKIQDAKNAVASYLKGKYTISNAIFDKNLKCIVVNDPVPGVFGGAVVATKFICTAQPLPYYNNNFIVSQITKTQIGVEVNNNSADGTVKIGIPGLGQNTFDNLGIGIKATNASLEVYNNFFNNITSFLCLAPCSSSPGISIWSINKLGYAYGLTIGNGSASGKNTFSNCTNGILAEKEIIVQIFNNQFSNVSTIPGSYCIKSLNNNARNILVHNSRFNKFSTGIWLAEAKNCAIQIVGNQFNQGNVNDLGNTAIRLQNSQPFGQQFTQINNNEIVRVNNGVLCTNFPALSIIANNVTFTQTVINSSPSRYGIFVENAGNSIIDGNNIKRNGSTPAGILANKLQGIVITKSPGFLISNNTITKTGIGIRCKDNCSKSHLQCNIMETCSLGVYLDAALIGTQNAPGTTPGLPSDNQWIAMGSNSVDIHSNLLGAPPAWFYRYSPAKFNLNPYTSFALSEQIVYSNPPYNCSIGCLNDPCKQQKLSEIIKQPEQTNSHQAENKIYAVEHVFAEIREKPALMQLGTANDALLQSFHDSILQTNTGKIRQIQEHFNNADMVQAKSINDALIPTNTIEQNYKTVNEIYLNSLAQERYTLDAVERNTLETVAYQHPLDGGRAVYSARVMLDTLIDDVLQSNTAKMAGPVSENDELEYFLLQDEQYFSKIYPNPNNGIMQLDYFLDKSGKLEITDLSGKIIGMYLLKPEERKLSISENFAGGVYFYRVTIDKNVLFFDKLVIIK